MSTNDKGDKWHMAQLATIVHRVQINGTDNLND
jgi:hypothetical protein